MERILKEAGAGDDFTAHTEACIAFAKENDIEVYFDFNDVSITVRGDSSVKLIHRDYGRAQKGFTDKQIGPYPAAKLSEEEIANDARLQAEMDERARKSQEEYQARMDAQQAEIDSKTVNHPMEFSNEALWKEAAGNNQTSYGISAMKFAEQWARLIQYEIAQGKKMADIANDTRSLADTVGLTFFQYGWAASLLSHTWVHGEELRRWYNKDTQIGDEGDKANESGGILNPALLSIS